MNEYVLDASAVLALLNQEPGHNRVAPLLSQSVLSSINLCEVLGKLIDAGIAASEANQTVELLGMPIVPFDAELALTTAELRTDTRSLGLSLGDRSCIALARNRGATAVTAERLWSKLKLGVTIEVIR
ncbi:MAG TPA: type II toxin-antitoxin system VapC family toxin [Pyrinomonadaceae bacterium]|nr:type II toxin-antitoxin system VapC family toxin [Pyrinomonadaceae bacterium]